MQKTLLPIGCYDILPPHARQNSELSAIVLQVFESFGYEQVAPPMLEYSESLLYGRGAALASQIFRLMAPNAHKVMGIRADITMQIARIAATRLSHAPRPLRLSYNGVILRMQAEQQKGSQPNAEQQLTQAGIELIGAASPEADAEVIIVAATALTRAGISEFSIDLNLPGIVASLLASEKLDNEQVQQIFEAVAHKDVSFLSNLQFSYRDTLIGLIQCAGPADSALAALERFDLPDSARQQCRDLQSVVSLLHSQAQPGWTITIDATENRGLSYHSGINFSIFVPGSHFEVGRGGRYRIEDDRDMLECEATGFTLYVETLAQLLSAPAAQQRIYLPLGTDASDGTMLRDEGYVTIHALPDSGADDVEAKRLGCHYLWKNKTRIAL